MDFLTASNRKDYDKVKLFDDGTLNAEGKKCSLISGGDTAMDCVRTFKDKKQNQLNVCIVEIEKYARMAESRKRN